MSKLPVVTAKELERALFTLGFLIVRQKGSHVFYRHADGRTTTIPHHKGHDVTRSLLRTILREIKVDNETFVAVLQK